MKKALKIVCKFLGVLLMLSIVVMSFAYWHVTTEWKNFYNDKEIYLMAQQINNSPKLSDNYYKLYETLFKSDRHNSNFKVFTLSIWDNLICKKSISHQSSFAKAAYFLPKKYGMNDYADFKLSWAIEKYSTSEKCFDFAAFQGNKRLKELHPDASIKDIINLNDTTEILKYFVIAKGPSLYLKRNDMLLKEINKLRSELGSK